MSEESERERFEADAAAYGFDLTRYECAAPEPWSEYADPATGHRWAGWSAALAWAATQQAPVAWMYSGLGEPDHVQIYRAEATLPEVVETPLYAHPAPAELSASQEREQTLREALVLLRCPEWAEKVQDEHAVEFDQFVAGVLRAARQKGGA